MSTSAVIGPAERPKLPPRGRPRAHSPLVRVLRVLLPLIMVGMVGLVAWFIVLHGIRRAEASRLDVTTPIHMINPRFFGRDAQNRPYKLSAEEASRDPTSFQRVLLTAPVILLNTGAPRPSSLQADRGVYQEDTRVLTLIGRVRGVDAKGVRFASERAVVDTRTGAVTGPKAVVADPAQGAIQSRAFDVYDKGGKVIFRGGVHARLNGG